MHRRRIWDSWLLIVALAMTAFGVFMALFSRTPLFGGFNTQINPAFWTMGIVDTHVGAFQAWVYGIWGATVAGFGLLAAFVIRGPYRRRQLWARTALAASIGLWFVLDTAISGVQGVWFNVAFNSAIFVALALPLAVTWNEFQG